MKRFLLLNFIIWAFAACQHSGYTEEDLYKAYALDGVPFIVADSMWQADGLGNHRAVVKVGEPSKAARATLPWRRADKFVDSTRMVIIGATTGEEIKNISIESISPEKATFIFEPTSGESLYYIYYMPYEFMYGWNNGRYDGPWNHYLAPEYNPSKEWLTAVGNADATSQAEVLRIESRSRFDAITSMGHIATQAETEQLRASATSAMVLFPEDRVFQIRLKDHLPARWAEHGPSNRFDGYACRNEYYAWQIGVWAAKEQLNNVRISFSDLECGKHRIMADSITCFNTEGVNWDGKPLTFNVNVAKDKVQALWCGVQIPHDAKVGTYRGTATISADNAEPQKIDIAIKVSSTLLEDRGEKDLWRMARLRWLNSQIGVSDSPTRDYKNIHRAGNTIHATEKSITLTENGLPASIKVAEREILAKPMSFIVKSNKGDVIFSKGDLKFTQTTDGSVSWQTTAQSQGIKFESKAMAEFDGYIHYEIEVSSAKDVEVNDICLVSQYSPYSSKYFMGVGHDGGLCPASHRWNWEGYWDSYWIGGANAGVRVELRGGSYNGPLMSDYEPELPLSWANKGKGYVDVKRSQQAMVVAGSGKLTLSKEPLRFEFDLQLTPTKPVNTAKHFRERYYHNAPAYFNEGKAEGANVANIHHANPENPVINYPFIAGDKLKAFINEQHKDSCRIKIYYTVRELTNYTYEIYALRSLGHEIIEGGRAGGTPG